jgi:hypothetical protein
MGEVLPLGQERGEMKITREGRNWIVRDGRTDERLGNQPADGARSHTNDVSCSDNPKVNKNGVPYLQIKSVSTPVITRYDGSQKRYKGRET